jgi:hypothetical protein
VSGLVLDGRPEAAELVTRLSPTPSVLELGGLDDPAHLAAILGAAAGCALGVHDPLWRSDSPVDLAALASADGMAILAGRARAARHVGARYLLVHAPGRDDPPLSGDAVDTLLRRAADVCAAVGVPFVIEPKARADGPAGMGRLLSGDVPSAGRPGGPMLCVDLSDLRTAAEAMGISAGRAAARLAGRADQIHLHARYRSPNGGWRHAPAGPPPGPAGAGWHLTAVPWQLVRRLARRDRPVQITVELVAGYREMLAASVRSTVRRFGPPRPAWTGGGDAPPPPPRRT